MTTTTTQLPEVGSFLATSWGYDQTNVDFYKVVGRTDKCVKIQLWTSKVDHGEKSADYVVPGDTARTFHDHSAVDQDADYWERKAAVVERECPVLVHRARFSGTSTTVAGHYASVWDGRPKYATASGWGH